MNRKRKKKGLVPKFSLRDKLNRRKATEEDYTWDYQAEEEEQKRDRNIWGMFPFSSFLCIHKYLWEKTLGIFIFLLFIYLLTIFSFPGVLTLRGIIYNAVTEDLQVENLSQRVQEVFRGDNLIPLNLQEEEEGEVKERKGEDLSFYLPLEGSLAGKYGLRDDPFTEVSRMHYGIDLVGSPGAAVKAAAPGEVEGIYQDPLHGLTITIIHPYEYTTLYGGLEEAVVEKGERVEGSSTLGFLREEENPLLHFQLRKQGHPLYPEKYIFLSN